MVRRTPHSDEAKHRYSGRKDEDAVQGYAVEDTRLFDASGDQGRVRMDHGRRVHDETCDAEGTESSSIRPVVSGDNEVNLASVDPDHIRSAGEAREAESAVRNPSASRLRKEETAGIVSDLQLPEGTPAVRDSLSEPLRRSEESCPVRINVGRSSASSIYAQDSVPEDRTRTEPDRFAIHKLRPASVQLDNAEMAGETGGIVNDRKPDPMGFPIRALIVSVEYSDYLSMTLAHNRPLLSDIMVVTAPQDKKTIAVAQEHEARIHLTEAFYRRGAYFNKFAAIEEGLDVFGRHGWILLMDADICIPHFRHNFTPRIGQIYTPYRRILKNVDLAEGIPEQRKWAQNKRPLMKTESPNFFQLFHASDRALGAPPWHSLDWTWAGSSEGVFQDRWSASARVRPPFEVLHLGRNGTNWAGRVTPFLDGSVPADAKLREDRQNVLLRSRVQAGKVDIFAREKLK